MTEIYTDEWQPGEPITTAKLAYMATNDRLYHDKLTDKPRGIVFYHQITDDEATSNAYIYSPFFYELGHTIICPNHVPYFKIDLLASRFYLFEVFLNNCGPVDSPPSPSPATTESHTAAIKIYINRTQVQGVRAVNRDFNITTSVNGSGSLKAFYVFQSPDIITAPFLINVYAKSGGPNSTFKIGTGSYFVVHDMGAINKTNLGV